MKRQTYILGWMIVLLSGFAGLCQAVTVQFDVHPKILRVGERATASFTVEGGKDPALPQLPPIDGIQMGQPYTSTSMQVINGRASSTYTVRYSLIPMRAGDFTFGPYKYRSEGVISDIAAVKIKVLDPQGSSANGQEQPAGEPKSPTVFAKIQTAREAYYHQEVFDIFFEIYFQRGLKIRSGLSINNLPESGLTLEGPVEVQAKPVQIGNEIYDVRRYRCKAHALTAGTFPLDLVLQVPLEVQQQQQRRRRGFFDMNSFFGGPQIQQVSVVPELFDLVIKPLPTKDIPPGFSGAVGIFTFEVNAKPTELQAGEPITIGLQISGAGNIETVVAPFFTAGDNFKTYDSRLLNDRIDPQQARGTKTFEQVVIPRTDDVRELPQLTFSYFNPVRGIYETIQRGPIPLVVHPAVGRPAQLLQSHVNGTKDQAQILGMDISYLQPEPEIWKHTTQPWYRSPVVLGSQFIPVFALLAIFLTQRRKEGLKHDVAKARRLRAPKSAIPGLRKADQALRKSDTASGIEGIWEALAAYFGDRLNLAPGETTPILVLSALEKGGMNKNTRSELSDVFQMCEEARFGGSASTDAATLQHMLKVVPGILKASEKIRL